MNTRLKQLERRDSQQRQARKISEPMRAFIVLDEDNEPHSGTPVAFNIRGKQRELPLSEFTRLYDDREFQFSVIHIVKEDKTA